MFGANQGLLNVIARSGIANQKTHRSEIWFLGVYLMLLASIRTEPE